MRFLFEHLIANAPQDKVIVTAGGCNASTEARSSSPVVDTSVFEADQEEADTRLVLHGIRTNNRETVVVSARDTDFLLLLVAHSSSIPSPNVWMMVGTAARRKFLNIKAVSEKLSTGYLRTCVWQIGRAHV